MIFAAPETGFGIDGNWFEDRRKAPLRKQTQRPRTGLLLDLVELKEIHVFLIHVFFISLSIFCISMWTTEKLLLYPMISLKCSLLCTVEVTKSLYSCNKCCVFQASYIKNQRPANG